MVDIWVIMSAVLKTGVLRRTVKHDLQSYLEFMIRIEASSRRELTEADLIDKQASLEAKNIDIICISSYIL